MTKNDLRASVSRNREVIEKKVVEKVEQLLPAETSPLAFSEESAAAPSRKAADGEASTKRQKSDSAPAASTKGVDSLGAVTLRRGPGCSSSAASSSDAGERPRVAPQRAAGGLAAARCRYAGTR